MRPGKHRERPRGMRSPPPPLIRMAAMHRLLWLVMVSLLAISVAGCATMRGVGEDLKNLGKGIEKSVS